MNMGRFDKTEAPTNPSGKAIKERDLHYQQGLIMAEIQELKGRTMILEGQILRLLRPRHSIRPQVQTAGLSLVVASIIGGIFELLRMIGILH
jgi:hypothetical protein